MARFFIGLPLDEEATRGVQKVVDKLKKLHWKVRWEPPDKWHVTLAFLGDNVEETEMPAISRLKNDSGKMISLFEIRFKGLDTFPRQEMSHEFGERVHGVMMRRIRLRRSPAAALPKLIYVRLGGELKQMAKLASIVRNELKDQEVGFDAKPFRPHVTIGRVKAECGTAERIEIGKTIGKRYELKIPQRWQVDRVCLYSSRLKRGGSEYEVIWERRFNGSGLGE